MEEEIQNYESDKQDMKWALIETLTKPVLGALVAGLIYKNGQKMITDYPVYFDNTEIIKKMGIVAGTLGTSKLFTKWVDDFDGCQKVRGSSRSLMEPIYTFTMVGALNRFLLNDKQFWYNGLTSVGADIVSEYTTPIVLKNV